MYLLIYDIMVILCEIVFIDECNFVNYGRFFIDEGDEVEDEEEYDIF